MTFQTVEQMQARIAELEEEVRCFRFALTPSAETKYLHMGEYRNGGRLGGALIEWTTVKEIMAAILKSATTPPGAALQPKEEV